MTTRRWSAPPSTSGFPILRGALPRRFDKVAIARRIRRAIIEFEPRLVRSTLRVEVVVDPDSHGPNALHFDIHGDLWCQPVPLRLYLRSELDLEDGEVRLTEGAAV